MTNATSPPRVVSVPTPKRPAITAPVRRGAIFMRDVIDADQLVVGGESGMHPSGHLRITRPMSSEQKSDVRRYLRWQDDVCRWMAALEESSPEVVADEDGEIEDDDLDSVMPAAVAGGAA